MKEKILKVAGYCRLSRDDDTIGESGSISTQKEIIKQYCSQHDMVVLEYYIDDGWTGTNFSRPDFQRMINDIECGKINCVITKDLSRLGRDYIMTGYYTEVYFPENNIRYIAINDGFDTINLYSTNNDIAPFKNLMNDMYAKDISKKIRSAKHAKAVNGECGSTYAPMGYKKDPNQKNHIIPDEETAWVVRKIFELYQSGMGVRLIRDYLQEHKILNPSALLHVRGERFYPQLNYDEHEELRYQWNSDMVARVLHNESYIGNSVHYANIKPTNKSKTIRNSKENYLIIENTHEPLIDKETFYSVQTQMKKHNFEKNPHDNVLRGIVKCYDCNGAMITNFREYHGKLGTTSRKYLTCNTYIKRGKEACTCHHTKYIPLCEALKNAINDVIRAVQTDESKVEEKLKKALKKRQTNEDKTAFKRMATIEKRLNDISRLLMKLYEDRTLGSLNEENFRLMTEKYQKEQRDLKEEQNLLKEEFKQDAEAEQNIKQFIDLCKDSLPITELTEKIAHTFIEMVYVHETPVVGRNKDIVIDIHFKFVGNVDFFK